MAASMQSLSLNFTHFKKTVPNAKVTFGQSLSQGLSNAAGVIVSTLYDKGPGVRYAVEQTLGYTFPRTAQQFYRNYSITGDGNPQAAKETFIRELTADFMDTFAPGLIATHIIGRAMDSSKGTLVKHNIENEVLDFYKALAKNTKGQWLESREKYIAALSDAIKTSATHSGSANNIQFDLAKNLKAMAHGSSPKQQAVLIAEQLGLKDLTLHLKTPAASMSRDLVCMLEEINHVTNMPNKQRLILLEKMGTRASWGKLLATGLQKTVSLKPYQLYANLVALIGSLSIPFVVRALTKRYYGHEAFPGTQEIHNYFQQLKDKNHALKEKNSPDYVPERIKLLKKYFPYLHQSLEKKNIIPTLFSAAFFGYLATMVVLRFRNAGASLFKAKDWLKLYQFDRGFPYTSVAQMEISYGLLCAIRLLASRNDAEFRETAFRDCILGFPTLTYLTDWLKPKVMTYFNNRLAKSNGIANILTRTDNELRVGHEITPLFYRNMGMSANKASALSKLAKTYHNWGTLMVAGTSWTLLAWLEPQIGIWLTNYFELNRYQPENIVHHKKYQNSLA